MATESHFIKIRSHNINGYNSSKEFLFQECDNDSFSILALQEHWLRPAYWKIKGTNQLKVLHPNFDAFGVSAMEAQLGCSIMKGRPFGGTGFLFEKRLSNAIRVRVDLKHLRVTVLELITASGNILLINAYMPYYDPSNLLDNLDAYRNTLGYIEKIMADHPSHKFILLMDMNCNIFDSKHVYSSMINSMMKDFGLVSTFNTIPNFDAATEFTRFDIKRNSYTLIDGILISNSLCPSIDSCAILHPPTNVSDHLPVEIVLKVEIGEFYKPRSKVGNFIPWSNLSEKELQTFNDIMLTELKKIPIPCHTLDHTHKICNNDSCLLSLESFYCQIISAVEIADQCLPRIKHGLSKPFWSPELNDAKQRSIDAHVLWTNNGSPRSGTIFLEYYRASRNYKNLLNVSKKNVNHDISYRRLNIE